MTDLCYNCGSCHLPTACGVPLATCIICDHQGHTWNFCHLGANIHQEDYRYFALCHNCDAWHLPDPCTFEAVQCKTCNSSGHLPYYCPIQPKPRKGAGSSASSENIKTSRRKRLIDDGVDFPPQGTSAVNDIGQLNPQQMLDSGFMADEVYKLKMNVVKDVLELSIYRRPQEVFASLAQLYLTPGYEQQPANDRLQGTTTALGLNRSSGWDNGRPKAQPMYQSTAQFQESIGAFGQAAQPMPSQASQSQQALTGGGLAPLHRLTQHDAQQQQEQGHAQYQQFPHQQQMKQQHEQQTRYDQTDYHNHHMSSSQRTPSQQGIVPDLASQLANGFVPDITLPGFRPRNAFSDAIGQGVKQMGSGEAGRGFEADIGRHEHTRPDFINSEGGINVVSTVEREAQGANQLAPLGHVRAAYSKDATKAHRATLGSPMEGLPRQAEGSPKRPAKRVRKAAAPRSRKSAAAKAKEAALAQEQQQQTQQQQAQAQAQAQAQDQVQGQGQGQVQGQVRSQAQQQSQVETQQQQTQAQTQQQQTQPTQQPVQQTQAMQQDLAGPHGI